TGHRTERLSRLQPQIGAQQCFGFPLHPPLQITSEPLHRHQGRNTEGDGREEEEEPLSGEAALPPGERENLAGYHALAVSETMVPSARRIVRCARAASSRSCVTSTRVVPDSRFSSSISAMIPCPVRASRLPVGSSANRIRGV